MVCAMEIVHVLKSWTFTHWVSPSYKLFLNVKFTDNRDHNWTFSMETLIWMSSHGPGTWFIRSKNSHLELIFFFWNRQFFIVMDLLFLNVMLLLKLPSVDLQKPYLSSRYSTQDSFWTRFISQPKNCGKGFMLMELHGFHHSEAAVLTECAF